LDPVYRTYATTLGNISAKSHPAALGYMARVSNFVRIWSGARRLRLSRTTRIGFAGSAAAAAAFLLGILDGPERTLLEARYQILHRPASNSLTLIAP
jgi:hypothetical protein